MTSDSVTCLRSRKRKHSQATAVESSLLPYDPLSCNCRPAACHEAPTPCFPSSGLKGDLSITGRRFSAECRRLRHFRACCALVEPFPCLAGSSLQSCDITGSPMPVRCMPLLRLPIALFVRTVSDCPLSSLSTATCLGIESEVELRVTRTKEFASLLTFVLDRGMAGAYSEMR